MYKVSFYKQVVKYYTKLDSKTQKRINIAVDEIMKNPFTGVHIKKLKGRLEGKYRYDIGELRIVYFIDIENKIIYVEAMGPRGDIYR